MNYTLPIFPLPEAVLFPRTVMALHIFEPRYIAMIETIMAGERKLALGHLREGYEEKYFGSPPIYRILTHARVLFHERIDDGRWNITIEGIERLHLIEEIQQEPYRIGMFDPIVEAIDPADRDEVFHLAHRLANLAGAISTHINDGRKVLTNLMNTHQHPGVVGDIIAAALVADHYARQSMLAERNILRRLRLLNIQLHHLAGRMRGEGIPLELPPETQ